MSNYSLDLISAILATPETQHPSNDDIAKVLEDVSFLFNKAVACLPLVLSARPGGKRAVSRLLTQLLVSERASFLSHIYFHVRAMYST